jgi:hypothetical protein
VAIFSGGKSEGGTPEPYRLGGLATDFGLPEEIVVLSINGPWFSKRAWIDEQLYRILCAFGTLRGLDRGGRSSGRDWLYDKKIRLRSARFATNEVVSWR